MSLTIDEIRKACETAKVLSGARRTGLTFGGMPIMYSPHLTEQETVTVEVERTFRERWVDPLLHPVRLPFEPWVRHRKEEVTREVPSRKIYEVQGTLLMHPMMRAEVMRACYGDGGALGVLSGFQA